MVMIMIKNYSRKFFKISNNIFFNFFFNILRYFSIFEKRTGPFEEINQSFIDDLIKKIIRH